MGSAILNPWATEAIEEELHTGFKKVPVMVNGEDTFEKRPQFEKPKKEASSTIDLHGIKITLYKYTFPDNRVYTEYVQKNSGGIIYLALKDHNWKVIPESLWSD